MNALYLDLVDALGLAGTAPAADVVTNVALVFGPSSGKLVIDRADGMPFAFAFTIGDSDAPG